jgi:hypothetical protein
LTPSKTLPVKASVVPPDSYQIFILNVGWRPSVSLTGWNPTNIEHPHFSQTEERT